MNRGEVPSSVNPRGLAVVDLTWVSPDLVGRVLTWNVDAEGESLSDHNYIRFEIAVNNVIFPGPSTTGTCLIDKYPRWNYGRLDDEVLTEVLEWSCMEDLAADSGRDISAESAALWIDRKLGDACDMAAPRAGKGRRRENAHWWNSQIADLRRACIRAKRLVSKFNRRRTHGLIDGSVEIRRSELRYLYRCARKRLRDAIRTAKLESWKELVASVDADPWGRPIWWSWDG